MVIGRATPLEDILEADWQRDVVQLAKTLGWLPYHTFNARGSAHGFPDLVFARDRVIYVEFKREKTKTTAKQNEWIRALLNAGAEVYIARPHDLEDIALILAGRLIGGSNARAIGWLAAAARLKSSTEHDIA